MVEAKDSVAASNLAQKFAFALLADQRGELALITSKVKRTEEKMSFPSNNIKEKSNLDEMLQRRRGALKPTVTVVRDGGCVDGKTAGEGSSPLESLQSDN